MIKHALLSLCRTKGRTFLFTLLILALTIVLTLGVSVWAAITQFLADADDFYTTIAQIEYIGKDYPKDTLSDPAMLEELKDFNLQSIISDPAVLSWNPNQRTYAYVEGFRRDDLEMPNRGQTILVVTGNSYSDSYNAYLSRAVEVLYSHKIEADDNVLINKSVGYLEPHHYYLLLGESTKSRLPFEIVQPKALDSEYATNVGMVFPTILDITNPDGKSYTIPEQYYTAARSMEVGSNSLTINGVDSLASFLPFHQAELYLLEGRDFTEEELANHAHVIVLTDYVAKRLGKGIGDSIGLFFSPPDSTGTRPSYWAGNGFRNQASFKIVGITNNVPDLSWHAFVPSGLGIPYSEIPIGYTVGQLQLKNDQAVQFNLRHQPAMRGRFIMTIYDQGYSNAAEPFQQILRIAQLLSIISGLVLLVVLIFFAYVFVYRQRETGRTMLMLGTEKRQVATYFLLSAGVIALIGTLTGALIAYRMHDRVIDFVRENASNQMLIDTRYSDGNLSISRTLEFAPEISQDFFLYTGSAVLVLALLTCAYFLFKAIFEQPKVRKTITPKKIKGRTSHLPGGASKYAILSCLRGGSRSLVVPLMAVVIVFFFGHLASTSQRYRLEIDQIYKNTQIQGRFTDYKGKSVDRQIIPADLLYKLLHSGKIDQLALTQSFQSIFAGIPILADGTTQEVAPIIPPYDNPFAMENFMQLFTKPGTGIRVIPTNDIRHAPEFFYSGNLKIEFLPGYDESFLARPTVEEEISYIDTYNYLGDDDIEIVPLMVATHSDGIVSNDLMKRLNARLGDTIRLDYFPLTRGVWLTDLDIHIVGTYSQQGNAETIYIPLSTNFDTRLLWGEGQPTDGHPLPLPEDEDLLKSLQQTTFQSAAFLQQNASQLQDLKGYFADQQYSQVNKIGRIRAFVVLEDAVFNNTVASIEQQIEYTDVLYPILVSLTILIALVVSYLITINRRMELATMRGLGSPKRTIFGSFFIEQLMLILLGVIIGTAGWYIWRGETIPLHQGLIVLFIIAYLIGASVSIGIALRQDLISILGDRD